MQEKTWLKLQGKSEDAFECPKFVGHLNVYWIWDKKDIEFDKLFRTIQFLKLKSYNTNSISIFYGKGSKTKNSSTFTSDTEHSYFFNEEEIGKINSMSDLEKLYKY